MTNLINCNEPHTKRKKRVFHAISFVFILDVCIVSMAVFALRKNVLI